MIMTAAKIVHGNYIVHVHVHDIVHVHVHDVVHVHVYNMIVVLIMEFNLLQFCHDYPQSYSTW